MPESGRAVKFAASVAWIARARHWATAVARDAGASAERQRVVALLTTEAVANAVVHGPHEGAVEVRVATSPCTVRVSVTDTSPEPPVLRTVEPSAPGGRGVMLIDRLASAWGVDHAGAAGKTVWFEVALCPPATGPTPA